MAGPTRRIRKSERRHGIADRQDGLGCIVGDFHAELFFEGHDKLDRIKAVRAQIVDEAGLLRDLGLVNAEMLDDDLPDACLDSTFTHLQIPNLSVFSGPFSKMHRKAAGAAPAAFHP